MPASSDTTPERLSSARTARRFPRLKREMVLRLVSAAVMIPAILLFNWHSESAFAVVSLLVSGAVYYEWLRMVGAGQLGWARAAGWAGLIGAAALALLSPVPLLGGAAVLLGVSALLFAVVPSTTVPARWVAFGLVYAGIALVAMVALRRGADGFGVVVLVFVVAWVVDTSALFVGRTLRGPKLWPRISPSKTWSGAVGGFVGGTAVGVAGAMILGVPFGVPAVGCAALISLAAIGGDLLESAAKRRFNCKDAGSIIPGHGGVMDRVDGLITASCMAALLGFVAPGGEAAGSLLALMGR